MKSILIVVILCAICSIYATTPTLKLEVSAGSNKNWIAVRPIDGAITTSSVEVMQRSGSWFKMTFEATGINAGYFTYNDWSRTSGFKLPLSFRLTGSNGVQIIINNAISTVTSFGTTMDFDSASQYSTAAPTTAAPTAAPSTAAPTTKAPTAAPSTAAPTTKAPTAAPSTAAPTTKAPTAAPSTAAPSTAAPTTKAPTAAPSTAAPTTKAPTAAPSTAAPTTQAPSTAAPTKAATTAGAPSSAATTKATVSAAAPSTAATDKATVAPISSNSNSNPCAAPTKILVPLYVAPGSDWDQIAAGAAYAPTVAIINPNSGPGGSPSNSYLTYMKKLHDAGVELVGYVYTSFGARPEAAVKADVDTYAQHFPYLSGIFLDEGSTSATSVAYYTDLKNYILSMPGYKYSMYNPGTTPAAGYVNAATQIMSYEDHVNNFAHASTPSGATCATKDKYAAVLYGVTVDNIQAAVAEVNSKGYYGWIYLTDRTDVCCIYNTLAPYYPALAAAVGAAA